MKSKNTFISILTGAALLLPISALAGNKDSKKTAGSSSGSQTEWSSQHASAQGHAFKTVSEDKLKQKLTADRLIGKKVVDRDGQTVGEVKDISLGQAFRDGSDQQQYSQSQSRPGASASGQVAGVSASGSIGTQSSAGTTGSMDVGGQINLYVELDNDVDVDGDDLATIPASSVRFDREKDELKLQISRQELATNLKQSQGTFSAAE